MRLTVHWNGQDRIGPRFGGKHPHPGMRPRYGHFRVDDAVDQRDQLLEERPGTGILGYTLIHPEQREPLLG